METFDLVHAGLNTIESVTHLRQIREVEGDMPFGEMRRAKPELAMRDAAAGTETGTFQMLEIPTDGGGKLKVAYIVLEAAPDVVDVHRDLSVIASEAKRSRAKQG